MCSWFYQQIPSLPLHNPWWLILVYQISDNPLLVRRLLRRGADPNLPLSNGETPLMVAAVLGLQRVCMCLLQSGKCNIQQTDRKGNTVLHKACHSGSQDVVHKLIEGLQGNFYSRNVMDDSPIVVAAKESQANCIKVILERILYHKQSAVSGEVRRKVLAHKIMKCWRRFVENYNAASSMDDNDKSQLPATLTHVSLKTVSNADICSFVLEHQNLFRWCFVTCILMIIYVLPVCFKILVTSAEDCAI